MSTAQATTPHATERTAERADLARKCLYYMTLMREIEDRIERKLYRQGKIVGGVYVGRGQEAIPVGSALVAGPEDVFLPSHRDMAVFFIRGVPVRRILAQYMGRVGGLTRGRDGNMHMGDLKLNIVSIISALAATVPVAARALIIEITFSFRSPMCMLPSRPRVSPPMRPMYWAKMLRAGTPRMSRAAISRWEGRM